MPARHRLEVDEAGAGERVDRFLAERLTGLSRSRLQRLIEQGHVRGDGAVIDRASFCVDLGLELIVEVPDVVSPEDAPRPQDLGLPILYQDSELLVVNKPAGMAVHPAPGSPDGTVVNAVLFAVADLQGIGGELRPGVVHRLDKDTTGLLLLAKSGPSLQRLQEQFRDRTVEKIYLALAVGRFREDEGRIEAALARHPKDRKRYTGHNVEHRPDARSAVTDWKVVERFPEATLLEVRPRTGRTHQIRVHLAETGHPLLGEKIYGRRRGNPPASVGRARKVLGHHALHAHRLGFEHPTSGERLQFEAPLPEGWEEAVELLRG